MLYDKKILLKLKGEFTIWLLDDIIIWNEVLVYQEVLSYEDRSCGDEDASLDV